MLKDLRDQGNIGNNYTYDAIGNLKSDAMEGIGNVSWNDGGKVTRVYKNPGSQPPRWMSFDYDVMGNRLMKRLDKATSLYVRDAKGNTMAVYEVKTEKKDGDTDAQAGQKLESFLAALYDQMPGGVNQAKTLNFIKYFIRPIEGADEQKITEIRNLLDGLRANGTVPPTPLTNKYNQVVSRINTLTGYDAPTNRDIFGANAEQYFRNHPWNPNILPPNLARTRHKTLRQKEVHLYGSSRLGVAERKEPDQDNNNKIDYRKLSEIRVQEIENPFVAGNISGIFVSKIGDVAYTVPEEHHFISRLGMKRYELVNHLGNVQAVISDRNIPHKVSPQIPAIDYYTADLLSATDYYPFGMTMAGRSLNTDDYRYGFNGKEFDQDWDGGGATYDYGFRIYDPRVARFLSVDPLTDDYIGFNPYNFALNNPLVFRDDDGRIVVGTDGKPVTYSRDDKGGIVWSANTSPDIQKIGNAMLETPTGEASFKRWQDSKTNVNLSINYRHKSNSYATTYPSSGGALNSEKQYESIDVIFYDKEIQKARKEGSGQRYENADENEVYGAVGSHEEGHNNAVQIPLDQAETNELKQDPKKNIPFNQEIQFRNEYHEKYPDKPNKDTWQKPYQDKGYDTKKKP